MAQVIWHESARKQLQAIHQYYTEYISPVVANNIVDAVMDGADVLAHNPMVGQVELSLQGLKHEFRYLVVRKHYKIEYFVEGDECHIAVIWDCRNNPELLPTFTPIE